MNDEQKYMHRCLELAALGLGETAPNPMVGCVVVHQGRIIGEGYHRQYGGPHAEVHAIQSVKNTWLLKDSILYVSLEPCAHQGKTPPCADLIIESKIPHVVVGTVDPFTKVAGKGIEKMRRAGIRVDVGLMEKECRDLNKRFFTFHEKKRPYIILKWAQSMDGFMDIDRNLHSSERPVWITNKLSKRQVHKQRSEESAILIGTNTAEKDNPRLTVREWCGKQPLRIVVDRAGRLKSNLYLFDGTAPTVIFCAEEKPSQPFVQFIKIDFQNNPLQQIFDYLYQQEILSLVVEGGNQLLTSIIEAGLWDEAHVYFGNLIFGSGVKAPVLSGKLLAREALDDCLLVLLKNIQEEIN